MNIAKMMTPKACTVCLQSDSSVRQGLEVLRNYKYTAIPVIDAEGRYIGCVTEGDFLEHILKEGSTDLRDHEHCRITDIIRGEFCPPLSIFADTGLVVEAIVKQNFVPIVDDRGCLCGILTRRAVISCLAEHEGHKVGTTSGVPLVWE